MMQYSFTDHNENMVFQTIYLLPYIYTYVIMCSISNTIQDSIVLADDEGISTIQAKSNSQVISSFSDYSV